MAMTRTEVAEYAASEFSELLDEAGLSNVQDGGLKTPIDRAMRMAGIPIAGPVPESREIPFLLIFDWAVLYRIERALANRVDVSVEGPSQSKRYSQATAHVKGLREEAWRQAEPFVVEEAAADDWDVGYINLDLIVHPMNGQW